MRILCDEVHHGITSLISFSWKCYMWPQNYLIYYHKVIKLISYSNDNDMFGIIILLQRKAQTYYKFHYNLQLLAVCT